MKSNEDRVDPTDNASTAEMSEEEIDANLKGSFPASDPPAWTLGSDHQIETNPVPESNEVEDE